ncbi:MAG: pentapeptide repeat-containing protein [Candidatus Latescibacteria bacterium]|nr:pentapeptide repeat-containing protein [Candidatus Latescibacterota bacterium]
MYLNPDFPPTGQTNPRMRPAKPTLLALATAAIHCCAVGALCQSLVLDFDLQAGDQGQREGVTSPGDTAAKVQLCLAQAPPFSGWLAQLRFDPTQARFIEGSPVAGSLVAGQEIRAAVVQEGVVEVAGSQAGEDLVSGEGDLVQLEFAAQPDAVGPVRLWVTSLRLETPEVVTEVPVAAAGAFALPAPEPPAAPALLPLAGDEALSHLTGQRACPGCDLRRQNLAQLDLNQVDLRQAQLQEATLLKANLQGADLRGALLRGALLLQADLRDARFQGAQLKDGRLGGAKLQGANFTGATLDTLDLQGVNLTGAIWVDGRICGSGSFGRCR